MKNALSGRFMSVAVLVSAILFVNTFRVANAVTPTYTASATGNSDYVTVTIHGDANQNVNFYYNVGSSSGMQTRNLGTTDANGNFTSNFSSSAYGVNPGGLTYVIVNGQQATMLTWPYTTGSSYPSNLLFSQTNVTLSVGQTTTVNSYASSDAIYLTNNSNSSVANFVISGTQVTITGNNIGSTTGTFCYQAYTSVCNNVSVTVTGSGTQSISFGQNNMSLSLGQYASVSISGGGGPYYISGNSNPSVVQTNLSGSSLSLTALYVAGASSITVCPSNSGSCATLSVTVGGGGSNSSIYFSQSNPSVAVGQSTPVTISGGTGTYYISSNSNSAVVAAYLSGSTLTLTGVVAGNSTVTICSSSSACGSLTATVGSSSGYVSFNQTNPTITIGQTTNVSVSGSSNYYISSNSPSGVIQASLNSNTLTLYGLASGTANINVCSSSNGGCSSLYVTVSPGGSNSSIYFSPSNPSVAVGQSTPVTISGGSGTYYISSNSNSNIATAYVSGNLLTVTGVVAGNSTLTVCSSSSSCNTVSVIVTSSGTSSGAVGITHVLSVGQGINLMLSGGSGSYSLSSNTGSIFTASLKSGGILTLLGVSAGTSSVNVCDSNGACLTIKVTVVSSSSGTENSVNIGAFQFNNPLSLGSEGEDVAELQKRLTAEGVYSGSITGYFGTMTQAAVKKYQTKYGINPLGNVGPATRAQLNK